MNHNSTFTQRASTVDVADEKFQKYVEVSDKISLCVRYGFDHRNSEIPINVWMSIPLHLRLSPDFFIISDSNPYFVEVKGCTDVLRLKTDDIKIYKRWDSNTFIDIPLYFYVYSVKYNKEVVISFSRLLFLIHLLGCKKDIYEDNGKEYYKMQFGELLHEQRKREKGSD